MTPELAMSKAVKRLEQLSKDAQALLDDWHKLPDAEKRGRVLVLKQGLDNARTLAQNWKLLAREVNGLEIPEEGEADED
jgi:capsid protein